MFAQLSVVVFVHRINELNYLQFGRRVGATHVHQGALYEFFDLVSVEKAVSVGVVLEEDEVDGLLDLVRCVADLVRLGVGLVLCEFAVEAGERALVLALGGFQGSLGGFDGAEVAQRLGLEGLFGVGTQPTLWRSAAFYL